jgi:hypothetical protein
MADDKKLTEEELADITGAGVADLGDQKKPAGSGSGGEGPEAEGTGEGGPTEWQP